MNRWWGAATLSLVLALGGCGGSDDSPTRPTPTASATVDEAAAVKAEVLDAFDRYYDDLATVSGSVDIPDDALSKTATGVLREQELTRLKKDADRGNHRSGKPRFKDEKVTISGDEALVVACINADDWLFVLKDGREVASDLGWAQLGRTLTKSDGQWLVSGYSPESTQEKCP